MTNPAAQQMKRARIPRHLGGNYVKGFVPHPGQYNATHYKQVWMDK